MSKRPTPPEAVIPSSPTLGSTPRVPSGWVLVPAVPPFPHAGEISVAVRAAAQLEVHAEAFLSVMPSFVTDPHRIAGGLRAAAGLSAERRRAEAWLAYVTQCELAAWRSSLGELRDVRSTWTIAEREGLAQHLDAVDTLVHVRKQSAKRSVRSRRRNAKSKAAPAPVG